MKPRAPRLTFGPAYRLAVALAATLLLAVAGGASHYSEDQQMLVRLGALCIIGATLWPLDIAPLRAQAGLLAGVLAASLLLAVQLAPLPPALWAALPGHAPYAGIAAAAGTVAWRPLSLTPGLTLNALLGLLPAIAAGLCFLYLDMRGRRWIMLAVAVCACLSAVLGLCQLAAGGNAFRLFRETSSDSAVGLFANRNHQAAFLACALPLIGAIVPTLLRDGARPWPAYVCTGAGAAILLLGTGLTGSRMGLLLAAIGAAGGIVTWRLAGGPAPGARNPRMRIALAASLAAGLLVVAAAAGRSGAIERLAATDSVSETRSAMLPALVTMARAFQPLGSGFGSFDAAYRRFEPQALLSTITMNAAHDEPLQLVIEGGFPALMLLCLFLYWWALTAMRILQVAGASSRRALGMAGLLVTFMLMLSSLVDYPLRTPLLGGLFAMAMVLMIRARERPQR